MTATPPSAEDLVRRLLATQDADQRRALIAGHRLSPEGVNDAVMRLLAEAERIVGTDPLRMEQICLDAVALAERAGDEYLRARARHRLGDALRYQGRNVEALACFDEAAAVLTRLRQPLDAARTRVGWVWVAAALGRLTEALAAARAARRVLRAHGDTHRLANLEQSVGTANLLHGRYRAALRAYTRAMTLHRSLGERGRINVARAHANRGWTLTLLGRYREAMAELELARDVYQQVGETAGAARVIRSIGEYQMYTGRYAAALRSFEAAQAAMRTYGLHDRLINVALNIAECYLWLNRPADALSALDETEEELRRTDNPQDALGVAVRRVEAHLMLGQREEALRVLDEAERRFPTGALQHRARLAAQRAAVMLEDRAPAEAIAVARRAGGLARAAGLRRLVVDAIITEGRALLALGQTEDAGRVADRARRLARAVDAAPLSRQTYELLGAVAEARGRPGVARRQYTTAIQQLEREQRGVIFEFRDSFAAGRGTAYERLASLQLSAGRHQEALATVEQAKSRALSDAIAGRVELRPRGNPITRRLARELAAAREEYAAAAARMAREQGDEAGVTGARAAAAPNLTGLESRIATLVRQLQLTGAGDDPADLYGAAPDPSLPVLPADTLLIEFFVSGDDVLRFRVDARRVRGAALAGAAPEVERLLRAFRLNLDLAERATDPARHDQLALQAHTVLARLYERLLGGLEGLDAYRLLAIVPHGLLHYLPFHALWDGERYLIERVAVSYAPSAALYGVCAARARHPRHDWGKALVLAHSGGGRLPFTLREAEAVGAVLRVPVHREEAATRALLQSEGRRAGLIHIAAHGLFRPDAPLFSGIELADGPLTVADVFDLDLPAALVTLSACETGRAVIGGGDELVGLVRAFLYAGVAGLLVSQWRVDDASTAALMARFYQELTGGAGPAQALRAAQVAFLSGEMRETGRSHPFFWAGFQIIGDDHGLEQRPARAREATRA
jgi:CHAT domain-containing protein